MSEPSTSVTYTSSINKPDKEKKYEQEKYKKIIQRQQLSLIKSRRMMKALRNTVAIKALEIQALKRKINSDKYKKALSSVFTEDQIEALFTKRRTIRNWSNETIKRALQLKFVCGANGYEELTRQGIPLPSLRTLRRRLKHFKFEPGISDLMIKFLTYKKSHFENETDFECGLIFDEMAITPNKCYNPSTESLIGHITFSNEKGNATHALVFMLVGIASRWKHVVGYHLTGNSFNSKTSKEIIFQIINKPENIGFRVNFITSDMDPGNTGLWRLLGISTGRFSKITNCITHPFDPNRYLYIIADPPHIFKNLKQALITNHDITIPNNIVFKYNLFKYNFK